jgi:hypothetical protein
MTVPELKGLCSKHGFMKKGNKGEIIDRLVNPPPIKQTKSKESTFPKLRARLIHHTPICLEEECVEKKVYADYLHMLQHPSSQEDLKLLEEKIHTLLPKDAKINFSFLKPYWITPNDGDLPLTRIQHINCPLLETEDAIPFRELKLVKQEHMIQRKISEEIWLSHDNNDLKRKESDELNLKIRGSMGYFPKHAIEFIHSFTNCKKETVQIATRILQEQLETFLNIRKKFWKKRFDLLKETVQLEKLRTYFKIPGT